MLNPESKFCVWYGSIYVTFWKRHLYRDRKQSSGYHGLRTHTISSSGGCSSTFFFFFFLGFYLFIWQTEITSRQRGRQRERREAGCLLSREADVGLNPSTLGSWPEPKAVTGWLSIFWLKCTERASSDWFILLRITIWHKHGNTENNLKFQLYFVQKEVYLVCH